MDIADVLHNYRVRLFDEFEEKDIETNLNIIKQKYESKLIFILNQVKDKISLYKSCEKPCFCSPYQDGYSCPCDKASSTYQQNEINEETKNQNNIDCEKQTQGDDKNETSDKKRKRNDNHNESYEQKNGETNLAENNKDEQTQNPLKKQNVNSEKVKDIPDTAEHAKMNILNAFIKVDEDIKFLDSKDLFFNIPIKKDCILKEIFTNMINEIKNKSYQNVYKCAYLECYKRNQIKIQKQGFCCNLQTNFKNIINFYFSSFIEQFSLFYFDFFLCIVKGVITIESGINYISNDLATLHHEHSMKLNLPFFKINPDTNEVCDEQGEKCSTNVNDTYLILPFKVVLLNSFQYIFEIAHHLREKQNDLYANYKDIIYQCIVMLEQNKIISYKDTTTYIECKNFDKINIFPKELNKLVTKLKTKNMYSISIYNLIRENINGYSKIIFILEQFFANNLDFNRDKSKKNTRLTSKFYLKYMLKRKIKKKKNEQDVNCQTDLSDEFLASSDLDNISDSSLLAASNNDTKKSKQKINKIKRDESKRSKEPSHESASQNCQFEQKKKKINCSSLKRKWKRHLNCYYCNDIIKLKKAIFKIAGLHNLCPRRIISILLFYYEQNVNSEKQLLPLFYLYSKESITDVIILELKIKNNYIQENNIEQLDKLKVIYNKNGIEENENRYYYPEFLLNTNKFFSYNYFKMCSILILNDLLNFNMFYNNLLPNDILLKHTFYELYRKFYDDYDNMFSDKVISLFYYYIPYDINKMYDIFETLKACSADKKNKNSDKSKSTNLENKTSNTSQKNNNSDLSKTNNSNGESLCNNSKSLNKLLEKIEDPLSIHDIVVNYALNMNNSDLKKKYQNTLECKNKDAINYYLYDSLTNNTQNGGEHFIKMYIEREIKIREESINSKYLSYNNAHNYLFLEEDHYFLVLSRLFFMINQKFLFLSTLIDLNAWTFVTTLLNHMTSFNSNPFMNYFVTRSLAHLLNYLLIPLKNNLANTKTKQTIKNHSCFFCKLNINSSDLVGYNSIKTIRQNKKHLQNLFKNEKTIKKKKKKVKQLIKLYTSNYKLFVIQNQEKNSINENITIDNDRISISVKKRKKNNLKNTHFPLQKFFFLSTIESKQLSDIHDKSNDSETKQDPLPILLNSDLKPKEVIRNKQEYLREIQTMDEFFDTFLPLLKCLGYFTYIYNDLQQSVLKILLKYVEVMIKKDNNNESQAEQIDKLHPNFYSYLNFFFLSLNNNCEEINENLINIQLWDILKLIPVSTRYKIYFNFYNLIEKQKKDIIRYKNQIVIPDELSSENCENNENSENKMDDILLEHDNSEGPHFITFSPNSIYFFSLFNFELIKTKIRKIIKRATADILKDRQNTKVKNMLSEFNFIINRNPFVGAEVILQQCELFDNNMIITLTESIKHIHLFSSDIFLYKIIEKQQLLNVNTFNLNKQNNMNSSEFFVDNVFRPKKLINLSLVSAIFMSKHPSVEFYPLLISTLKRIFSEMHTSDELFLRRLPSNTKMDHPNDDIQNGEENKIIILKAHNKKYPDLMSGYIFDLEYIQKLIEIYGGTSAYVEVHALNEDQLDAQGGFRHLKKEVMIIENDLDMNINNTEYEYIEKNQIENDKLKSECISYASKVLLNPNIIYLIFFILSKLKHEYLYDSNTYNLKNLSSIVDQTHAILLQYIDFLQANSTPKLYISLIPNIITIFQFFDISQAFQIVRFSFPFFDQNDAHNDSHNDNHNELEVESEHEYDSETEQETDAWTNVMMPIVEKYISIENLNGINIKFYLIYWRLHISDIYVPHKQYQKVVDNFDMLINNLEKYFIDNKKNDDLNWIHKKIEKLNFRKSKVKNEYENHIIHTKKIKKKLSHIIEHWVDPEEIDFNTFTSFVKCLIAPRILNSEKDSLFCSKFIQLLIEFSTPLFNLCTLVQVLTKMLIPLINTCTEKESLNVGIFFNDLFSYLYILCDDVKYFNNISNNNPCFSNTLNFESKDTIDHSSILQKVCKWENYIIALLFENNSNDEKTWINYKSIVVFLFRLVNSFPYSSQIKDSVITHLQNLQDISKAQGWKDILISITSLKQIMEKNKKQPGMEKKEEHETKPQETKAKPPKTNETPQKSDSNPTMTPFNSSRPPHTNPNPHFMPVAKNIYNPNVHPVMPNAPNLPPKPFMKENFNKIPPPQDPNKYMLKRRYRYF